MGAKSAFSQAQRDGSWLSAGPLQPGIRACYRNNLLYVGNIVGEAHPIIAEGISMAMQSAWILSTVLLGRKKDAMTRQGLELLSQEYSKKWQAQFAHRIHTAALFAQIATRQPLMRLFLPLLKRFPTLLTYGATLSGKIKDVTMP